MRRLVFRAWDTKNNVWVDLDKPNLSFIHDQENYGYWKMVEKLPDGGRLIRDDLHFMQYTGLYDDRGCEIAEGDVVYAYKPNSHLEGRYVVVWDFKRGRWAYQSGNIIEKYQVGKTGNMHCVVNGNLFEDAEFKYILKK